MFLEGRERPGLKPGSKELRAGEGEIKFDY